MQKHSGQSTVANGITETVVSFNCFLSEESGSL